MQIMIHSMCLWRPACLYVPDDTTMPEQHMWCVSSTLRTEINILLSYVEGTKIFVA